MDRKQSLDEESQLPPVHQRDSVYKSDSFDESGTKYSGYFPAELPMRTNPPPAAKGRGRLRSFFTFSLSSFSIVHTPDGAVRLRHMAMVTIMLLRTAMSALSILWGVVKGSVADIVIYSLLAVLSLWFTATCLAIIGDVEGDRQLKRFVLRKWYLDFFLGFCVVVHAGLIVAFFFGLGGWGLEATSIGMWLAILAVAWVVGWQPKLPAYQSTWIS